jgi:hypothetical protein
MFAEFALDRREEAFHDGIVPTVAPSAHTADNAAGREEDLVIRARARPGFKGSSQRLVL